MKTKNTTKQCLNLSFFLFVFFIYLDKLQRQHGTHRDASYELRAVCLTAIQMALETKRPKFISLALNGMHVRRITASLLHLLRLSLVYA